MLQSRAFRRLWLAVLVSGIGDVLFTVGVLVVVYQRTASPLLAVLVSVANILPPFLMGPLAGYVVDRVDRRAVMVTMDAIRMVVVLALLWRQDLWMLYATVATLAMANAFYLPARQSIIPALVGQHSLVKANSIITATVQTVMGAGFLMGGVLSSVFDFTLFVAFDALTFAIAGGLVLSIRFGQRPASAERVPLWSALKSGFDYLRAHRVPRALLIMETLEFLPHGLWSMALFLTFVERALHGDTADFGVMAGLYFVGEVIGALMATRLTGFISQHTGKIIIANTFLFATWTLIFALSPNLMVANIVTLFFGPSQAMRDVGQNTLLQTTVPATMLGRVYAVREMGWRIAFTGSAITFAALVDVIGVRTVYVVGSLLYVMVGLYAAHVADLRRSTIPAPDPVALPQPIPA